MHGRQRSFISFSRYSSHLHGETEIALENTELSVEPTSSHCSFTILFWWIQCKG